MKLKNIVILFLFFAVDFSVHSQEIKWATKLIEYSKKFQQENNYADMVLGSANVYPDTNLYSEIDPYAEGYILNFQNIEKKNKVVVGFNKPIEAEQLIIGGIFNSGSIQNVNLILGDGTTKKNIFTFNGKSSVVKFYDFHVFFQVTTIIGVEIEISHRYINKWNILKGVGLTKYNEAFDILPYEANLNGYDLKKVLIDENIKGGECFLFNPKITPDGNTLYLVKQCPSNGNDQDIWVSSRDDLGRWGELKNIGRPLNNKAANFVASVGHTGDFLLVGGKYDKNGNFAADGASKTYKDENGVWKVPEPIEIPNYVNNNEFTNFFLSYDENYIIYSAEDDRSVGDLDLYVTMYNQETKKWSESIHLGNQVNTSFLEDYPYLANDGKTLFFSSKGHIGYGGLDVYMTRRLDDTWQNWSQPLNMGTMVNTKTDDKGFILSDMLDFAYLNSASFDKDRNFDVYKISLPNRFLDIEMKDLVKTSNVRALPKFELKSDW
ncbi:MAG: hypothetical protein EAZ53_03160 [Bacteroidetes bacterium]|nr:MAG: hypothetical protein EAZ53_03160 [Bacteroidota bacterium]